MQNNLIIKALGLGVTLAAIVLTAMLLIWNTQRVQGSVSYEFGGYNSTTTHAYNGTSPANLTVLKSTPGMLGSVVITGAAAGVLNFYDATTTNASLRTKSATTTVVTIPASAATGTYTFDAVFNYGLIYEVTGTVPTSTVTWK